MKMNPLRWCCVVLAGVAPALAAEATRSAWVHPGPDGRLAYQATPEGDRVLDFSYAGYGGGGVALPDVPVKATVKPQGGGADDAASIQAAIDRVSALPLENGFRGAVLLAPGVFNCGRTLTLSADGVVLRGSGSTGEGRSTLRLSGAPHLGLAVRGAGGGRRGGEAEEELFRTTVSDAYVPAGARRFAVADAKGFAVGDTIAIRKPVTEAWVRQMEMHDLTRDNRPQTWIRAGTTLTTERRIAAIERNTLTLDVPVTDSFDARQLSPPGTVVAKIRPPARVSQVGIEYLHVDCPPQEINHTQAHFTALRLNGQDCWVRDVLIEETMDSVGVGGRRITLERVTVRRQAKHQGASKPAEFAPNASEVLLDRCAVLAENVWFVATGAAQAGPIVVLNGNFVGNGRAEAHQRWSTGMLYDNCRAPGGGLEMRNRGAMGSGHGWAMGWGVIWNCTAKEILVQNPPGARNWVIGTAGHRAASPRPFGSGAPLPGGTDDSPGVPVAPQSLYLAQLAERLGPQALRNIGYASTDPRSAKLPALGEAEIKTAGLAPGATAALGENLALDRPVLTSNQRGGDRRFAGWEALDEDDATWWATDDGQADARLELDTEGSLEINALELREAADFKGQVRSYRVEGFVESAWRTLAEGTTIGERQVHRFPTVTVWKVRLTITAAAPFAAISRLGLYHEKR